MADDAPANDAPDLGGLPRAEVFLLGGLLRLDALHPDGFDLRSLADHACLAVRDAGALIATALGSGHVVRADGAADVYRLTPFGREVAVRRLAEHRRRRQASAAALGAFAPLKLLEAALNELRGCGASDDERRPCLIGAQVELAGCDAELAAAAAATAPYARAFAERLDAARRDFMVEARRRV